MKRKTKLRLEALEVVENMEGRWQIYLDLYNQRYPRGVPHEEFHSEPILISDVALLMQNIEALRYYLTEL